MKDTPLILSLQGIKRKIIYVGLYETIAIILVTLVLLMVTKENAASSSALAILSSIIAITWNLIFNSLFEAWERKQSVKGRSIARRVAHAIGYEGGLLFVMVPFFAYWLGQTWDKVIAMNISFLIFFLIYTYIFTWIFDKLFGLPAAAAAG